MAVGQTTWNKRRNKEFIEVPLTTTYTDHKYVRPLQVSMCQFIYYLPVMQMTLFGFVFGTVVCWVLLVYPVGNSCRTFQTRSIDHKSWGVGQGLGRVFLSPHSVDRAVANHKRAPPAGAL